MLDFTDIELSAVKFKNCKIDILLYCHRTAGVCYTFGALELPLKKVILKFFFWFQS